MMHWILLLSPSSVLEESVNKHFLFTFPAASPNFTDCYHLSPAGLRISIYSSSCGSHFVQLISVAILFYICSTLEMGGGERTTRKEQVFHMSFKYGYNTNDIIII